MSIKLRQLLTLTLLYVPYGSGYSAEKPTSALTTEPAAIRFEMEQFARSSGNCADQHYNCATIKMSYPVAQEGDAAVLAAINNTILSSLITSIAVGTDHQRHPRSLAKAADGFLAEYREFTRDDDGRPMGWSVETSGDVSFQNDELAVLALDTYTFTGGAHPNSYTELFNFDTATGKALGYEDFVSDVAALRQVAEQKFKRARELPQNANLAEEGFFWEEAFKLPENFAITKNGLRLVYNPYEAAPYAFGPTDFVIPWNELGEFIEKQWRF